MQAARIVGVVVLIVVLLQTVFIVSQPELCMIVQFGAPVRVLQEPGLYFKYPLIQEAIYFDKRVLVADARPSEYITLDKKRLTVDTVSRWKIVDPLAFYQTVRNYPGATARLNELILGRLRQEIANYNFQDFISEKRESIMEQVAEGAAEGARRFGINVIDARIKRVDLPEEVQQSVFARMKAERQRIAMRYRAEGDEQAREIRAMANKEKEITLAEAYRQAETLRGQGDAEAAGIYADAYGRDPEFFSFLRRLDVYRRVFATDTTLILRSNSDLLRFFEGSGPAVVGPGVGLVPPQAK